MKTSKSAVILPPLRRKITPMPKKIDLPNGQIWIRWVCRCCKKSGIVSLPGKGPGSGTFPFEVALGIHRTIMRSCNVKDVTMRGGQDGVLEVVMERGKSAARSA